MVMRSIYSDKFSFSMGKHAQFFILSAVIMATIIVSLASVKNYVGTGDAPKKFYYYSQQLSDETGAVVDFALYNDPTGNNATVKANLNGFLQQGISKTMDAYPNMQLFSCYSAADSTKLTCQNNGTVGVKINTSSSSITLSGSRDPSVINWVCSLYIPNTNVCFSNAPKTQDSIGIGGKTMITITPNGGVPYNIPIQSSSVQRGQFYFIMKMNSTSGSYVSDSTGTRQL